ncbi:6-phosphogluconate dehydrogenase [Flavobacterium sp. SUN052]|uniref:6-phosphogluconate dehydrogenase n=1 Tax=Flavobacterium sp. SUN052 TaxID=3002441 RepID=UPI00237D5C6B|nr:6-phosphogluconate dehydrogenase [Flavobacterium sp. SUN052]MEC4005259.1 6-phosphogluconate dehydrogenase [Flavobacterium sp. SUN052]
MVRKIVIYFVLILALVSTAYFCFEYYASYSDGVRSGQLTKFSHKGIIYKTWEGEISNSLSGSQVFTFSVLDKNATVIDDLKELEGQYVKVTYKERYRTFPWWGDSKYFVTAVKKDKSPFNK